MWRSLSLVAGLAACAPLPGPPAVSGAPAPALVPLGGLLAASDALDAGASPGPDLTAAAAALAARAGAIPAPAPGEGARVAALSARADALRGAVLSDAERARLGGAAPGGPSLR